MPRTPFRSLGGGLIGLALLAACGGGGGASSAPAVSGIGTIPAQAAPAPTATPAPVSSTVSIAGSVQVPSDGGISGSILFNGSVPAGTTAVVTTAFGPPSAAPTPASSSGAPVVYSWLSFNNAFALATLPTFTFNVPSTASAAARRPQAGTYGLQFYTPGGSYQSGGGCTANGSVVTCGGTATGVSFSSGATYVFVLLNTSGATSGTPLPTGTPVPASSGATATPAAVSTSTSGPTSTPSSIATGTPAASPSSAAGGGAGAGGGGGGGTTVSSSGPSLNASTFNLSPGSTAQLTVSDSTASTFTVTSANPAVVSVSPASGGGPFTLTPAALSTLISCQNYGVASTPPPSTGPACAPPWNITITVTDSNGMSSMATATVTGILGNIH